MFNAKTMQNLSKLVTQALKPMTSENKGQSAMLDGVMKALAKGGSGGGDIGKLMKDLSGTLLKVSKLVETQSQLLDGLKVEDLKSEGGDEGAEQAKELEEAVKKITDENKKQAAEIDSLLSEIDKVAKEADGDKDAAKKIKTATQALEKAVKLIDEQSKLLDEARKALAA